MTAEIKTAIGQLTIVRGNWQNEAPNQVAVREPKSADGPGAGKGDLFVLTEVRGLDPERISLEQQLAKTIRDAYYLSRGSITASLRRALQATNNELYRHNRTVKAEKMIVAGAVVLVRHNDEVFVAQIGPPVFFAILDTVVRRYPSQSLWLDQAQQPKEPALGLNPMAEPCLHHMQVAAGDMLVLADSQLASQLPLERVVKSVVPGNARVTIKNLAKASSKHDGSAMALAIMATDPSPLTALKRHAPPQLSRFLERERQDSPPPTAKVAPPFRRVAEPGPEPLRSGPEAGPGPIKAVASAAPKASVAEKIPGWLGRLGRSSAASPSASTLDPTAGGARYEPDEWPDPVEVETQPAGRRARTMHSVANDSGFHPEFSPGQATKPSLALGRILRWISAGLLLIVALLGNSLKNILRLVLPDNQQDGHRQAGAYVYRHGASAASWTLLRNIVIVIPVIVAIVVAISYLQKGRLREAEYNQFMSQAQEKFQQAQAVNADPAVAIGLLAESEVSLGEAEKIKGPQAAISELREQLRQTADRVGKVQRLYYLPQLRYYGDSGANPTQLVLQGLDLYVLDPGSQRVFHHRLDDLGETLLPDDESLILTGTGQPVDTVTVGKLIHMTWMPAGGNRQTSDLIILSDTGLLEYNPSWGITTAALANQEGLMGPVAVSSYFGNFYVLDPPANQILRYLPTPDGYSAPPEPYFPADQPADLAGAVDLAIDGAVYILYGDGRISKFQGGRPVDFNLTGLDLPLTNPVALYTAPDEVVQYLYVADAGRQRIVQLEKDGRFVRQFKPGAGEAVTFARLQDIFVDEISGRLYILDNNTLYAGNIPTLSAE
jgi:hypothetical protein